MRSNSREEVAEAFDALSADLDRALELDFDALTPRECLALLQRCERLRRRLPAVEHPLVNRIATTDPAELGNKPRWVLADELHITRGESARRITEAAELGPRRTLTGEPLEPVLPEVATAQRQGQIGAAHIGVIRSFFHYLPDGIDAGSLAQAEHQLAELAGQCRPDELNKIAQRLADYLHPDGNYTKERGCSHPNCPISGYYCEVHHDDDDYAKTRRTDINGLTLRCGPHHELITSGGWKTRKRHDGTTQTLPPPHLNRGQPRTNHYHHRRKTASGRSRRRRRSLTGPVGRSDGPHFKIVSYDQCY